MHWTVRQSLPAWWSFLWRVALFGLAAGFLVRVAAYSFGKSGVIEMQAAISLSNAITGILYLPVSFVAMRRALSVHAVARVA